MAEQTLEQAFELGRAAISPAASYYGGKAAILSNELSNDRALAKESRDADLRRAIEGMGNAAAVRVAEINASRYDRALADSDKRQQAAAELEALRRLLQNVPALDNEDLSTPEGRRAYQQRALKEYGKTILQPKIDQIAQTAMDIDSRTKTIRAERESSIIPAARASALAQIANANPRVAKLVESGKYGIDRAISEMLSAGQSEDSRSAALQAQKILVDARDAVEAQVAQLSSADEIINNLKAAHAAQQVQLREMEIPGAIPHVDYSRAFRSPAAKKASSVGEDLRAAISSTSRSPDRFTTMTDSGGLITDDGPKSKEKSSEESALDRSTMVDAIASSKKLNPTEKAFLLGAAGQVQGQLGSSLLSGAVTTMGPFGPLRFLPQAVRDDIAMRLVAAGGSNVDAVGRGYEETAKLGDLSVPWYEDPTSYANFAGQAAVALAPMVRMPGGGSAAIPPRIPQVPPVVATPKMLGAGRVFNMPGPVRGLLPAPEVPPPIQSGPFNMPGPAIRGALPAPPGTFQPPAVVPARPPSFSSLSPIIDVMPIGPVPKVPIPIAATSEAPAGTFFTVPPPAPRGAVGYAPFWRGMTEKAGIPGIQLYKP